MFKPRSKRTGSEYIQNDTEYMHILTRANELVDLIENSNDCSAVAEAEAELSELECFIAEYAGEVEHNSPSKGPSWLDNI